MSAEKEIIPEITEADSTEKQLNNENSEVNSSSDLSPVSLQVSTVNTTQSEQIQSTVVDSNITEDNDIEKETAVSNASDESNMATVDDENYINTPKLPQDIPEIDDADEPDEDLLLRWEDDESNDQVTSNDDVTAKVSEAIDETGQKDTQENVPEKVLDETLECIKHILTNDSLRTDLVTVASSSKDIDEKENVRDVVEENNSSSKEDSNPNTTCETDQDAIENVPCVDIEKRVNVQEGLTPAIDSIVSHVEEGENSEQIKGVNEPNIKNSEMDLDFLLEATPLEPVETPIHMEIEDILEQNPQALESQKNYEIDDTSLNVSLDDSVLVSKAHRLNQPDVMLEIPTQELIDIDDAADYPGDDDDDDDDIQKDVDDQHKSDANANKNEEDNEVTIDANRLDLEIVSESVKENTENDLQRSLLDTHASEESTVPDKTAKIPDNVTETPLEESLELIAKDITNQSLEIGFPLEPSTSGAETPADMAPDTDEDLPETDSLGLLTESCRVMDDEEPENDDDGAGDGDDGEADDDDESDQDDESCILINDYHSDDDSTIAQCSSEVQEDFSNSPPAVQAEEQSGSKLHAAAICNDEQTEKAGKETEVAIEDIKINQSEPINVPTLRKLLEMKPTNNMVEAMQPSSIEADEVYDTSPDDGNTANSTLQPELIKINADVPSVSSSQSPSKTKKLEISQPGPVVSIVDLEESSSDDDAVISQMEESETQTERVVPPEVEVVATKINIDGVTSVNIPSDIEVMSSGGNTSEILAKEGEVVISGVPKPPPHKLARLNTSEVSIKTVANVESTLVIPETKAPESPSTAENTMEVFNVDSDEEESNATKIEEEQESAEIELVKSKNKCANSQCSTVGWTEYFPAGRAARAHYGISRTRKAMLCTACVITVHERTQNLIDGMKELTPLLDLDMGRVGEELVEISDSDSEGDEMEPAEGNDAIGERGAKFIEENLATLINETWKKYNMDERLKDTQDMLDSEIQKLETESKEIDAMLSECQKATDKLRTELYATFQQETREMPGLIICDMPNVTYTVVDSMPKVPEVVYRQPKRIPSLSEIERANQAKVPTPPPEEHSEPFQDSSTTNDASKDDDDKDISVVKLSAEAAPADLPPRAPAELPRAPLRPGLNVYAMKNAFGSWIRGKLLECQPKTASSEWTMCRVMFTDNVKNPCKVLPGRCLAYCEPSEYRMTIGTRVIALFKDAANASKRPSYYSGIVAEIPNPVNNYRYLIFFDVGSAQYVRHGETRLVCESSAVVWEDTHPFSRPFVRDYLTAYPERPMVRLHPGQRLRTEWNGKWWSSRVVQVDASLVEVHFPGDDRSEWIYRGSTRLEPLYNELQVAQRPKHRALPRSKAQPRSNSALPYVEYTRTDEQGSNKSQTTVEQPPPVATPQQQHHNEEMRRQRAVAKKSTSTPASTPSPVAISTSNLDSVTSRVVYYTPKNAVKPYKMTPHMCGPKCKRSDVLALKDLRTYNPLAKPLLSGWERQLVRFRGQKQVMYRTPCGRRVRSLRELHHYLRLTRSDMPVDLFDFHPATHCLAEFVLNKCIVWKRDLSHGKENVPVPCVNYYDESLPEFCSYNTERTPTAGVPLNLDPEFLCGCDCTDDCEDKSRCSCWKLTLEGARTIGLTGDVGYSYRRLPEPLPSGIYECNSRCKCKNTCLNRVVQHPLQLKLQVFKTLNRGWGIRALNDVPKGSFLCVYAGNLLTDATANLDGLNEGDEYLAELDYIEVVEQMKEGYEEDVPAADKALDKEAGKSEETSEESSPSDDEEQPDKNDQDDDDFRPGYIDHRVTQREHFNKRLRRRTKDVEEKESNDKPKPKGEDCITISDDEEVREPTRFTAQAGMGANQFIPKYKSVRSHFGEDEACYIMDAKVQGNIGRYLNHSCSPNVFVQNVFVDTHDPRFPWVSFFALSNICAGTELTWNYNYDIGSVPGKVLYCYCGTANCRGRLL